MTDCTRCGDCCERIHLSVPMLALLDRVVARPSIENDELRRDVEFMSEHWSVVEAYDDGSALLSCDKWDATTRLCTAHDDRPPVCRGYPWYGSQPSQAAAEVLPPRCSFRVDVIPIDMSATR